MRRSVKFYCYFDSPKRSVIKLNTYVEAIRKTLNVFDDEYLMQEVDSYSEKIDINDGFEYAKERYKDLVWAKKQILNTATIGLYHLWEKAIRDVFVAQLRCYMAMLGKDDKSCKKSYDLVLQAKFLSIKKALEPYLQVNKSLETIAELSQVVNALKHGEGSSFYFLEKKAPNLINANALYMNEKIEVSRDKFEDYYQALNEFWHNLPENLWIQIKE